jgi:hypothetical protein
VYRNLWNLGWRIVPLIIVILITSWVVGTEIVHPHQRLVKVTILFIIIVIMLRFQMIYSLYLFILLYLFPSGITYGSTNLLLMTLIPLLWVIRATSSGVPLLKRTELDGLVIVLILAHAVSFFNMESMALIKNGLRLFWRQIAAMAFFYLIVRFVDDEKKLEQITKVIGISTALLVSTGVVELIAPGATIIPGWIATGRSPGELALRTGAGLRLGGAVASHAVFSDYCVLTLFFLVLYMLRSKNPIEKLIWVAISVSTFLVMLATANRGALIQLVGGLIYLMFVFRKQLTLFRLVAIITAFVAFFAAGQLFLDRFTLAASITERLIGTEFVGIVPDTRVGTWSTVLIRSRDHIIIGHGPWFRTGVGLEYMLWPHNSYIFYLYMLGIFGLSAFLLICLKLVLISRKYSTPDRLATFSGKIMGVLHIQLIMFLVGQIRTDHQRNSDYTYMFFVWMLFALIVATAKIIRNRERQADDVMPPPK